jgi:hypothetical protein
MPASGDEDDAIEDPGHDEKGSVAGHERRVLEDPPTMAPRRFTPNAKVGEAMSRNR